MADRYGSRTYVGRPSWFFLPSAVARYGSSQGGGDGCTSVCGSGSADGLVAGMGRVDRRAGREAFRVERSGFVFGEDWRGVGIGEAKERFQKLP